jgi:hypothetical protein
VPRIQLAAASVLAHLDEGWENSVRRKALYSILFGPLDWTTTAAIITLSYLAIKCEVISPDIHQAFLKVEKAVPKKGFCCYLHALYYNWQSLPHLFPHEREHIQKKLRLSEEDR